MSVVRNFRFPATLTNIFLRVHDRQVRKRDVAILIYLKLIWNGHRRLSRFNCRS